MLNQENNVILKGFYHLPRYGVKIERIPTSTEHNQDRFQLFARYFSRSFSSTICPKPGRLRLFNSPFFSHAETLFSLTPQISATCAIVRYLPLGMVTAWLDTDFVSCTELVLIEGLPFSRSSPQLRISEYTFPNIFLLSAASAIMTFSKFALCVPKTIQTVVLDQAPIELYWSNTSLLFVLASARLDLQFCFSISCLMES